MEVTLMDATRPAAVPQRLRLAHLPTSLEPLERLSRELGGPTIWVKRDDLTGLAGGGNKTRKLEYLLGDALDQGADTIITTGSVQSNHARQTAAACARLGVACELFLVEPAPGRGKSYRHSGNVLLDRIFGAEVRILPSSSNAETAMQERAEALRGKGRRPYAIPLGGSNAVGALGYIECARELSAQVGGMGLVIDTIVHASASHGTQAGLAAGLAVAGAEVQLLGVGVSGSAPQARANIERIAAATCERLGSPTGFAEIDFEDRFVGEGYGIPTPEGLAAIRLLARLEGLLLDPVYTGKAMAGLVTMIREGRFSDEQNIIFLHTGGWPALFAYEEELAEEVAPR
jgi:L-cysteate sulfo-lyase